jgi:hypothetical protein
VAEGGRRRERDRATTERNFLDAAWKLFERDGILEELRPVWLEDRRLPFVERRLHAFDVVAGGQPTLVKLMLLRILEGSPNFNPLILDLERARTSIAQDVENGTLPAGTDVDLAHVMPLATYVVYALLREWVAEELELELDEVDQRARPVLESMLRGPSAPTVRDTRTTSSTAA